MSTSWRHVLSQIDNQFQENLCLFLTCLKYIFYIKNDQTNFRIHH